MSEFDGLVAAVTGGASGIGAATVRVLRERGAKVAVLGVNVKPEALPEGQGELPPLPEHDLAVTTDVTDDASVRAAIDRVAGELGGLDVLVNCAGIGAQGDVTANEDDEWLACCRST